MRIVINFGRALPERPVVSNEADWKQSSPRWIAGALESALRKPGGGWFVVDAVRAITDKPRRYMVAGQSLVLWRAGGKIIAAPTATSILCGGTLFALGWFRLGNFVRYIPYPVVGGFLAGTGLLLLLGGIGIAAGASVSVLTLPTLFEIGSLGRWLPGLVFAVLLFITTRRISNPLTIPLIMLAAIGIFYAYLFALGSSVQEASQQGLLMGPFPEGNLWSLPPLSKLVEVDWRVVIKQAWQILSLVVISIISLLLNAGGLELEAQGRRLLVLHGDGEGPGDIGYKLLRRLVRSRPVVGAARLLHPDLLQAAARAAGRLSRNYTNQRPPDMARLEAVARGGFERGADAVLLGHVHTQLHRQVEDGELLVIGDWLEVRSFVRHESGRFTLGRFDG